MADYDQRRDSQQQQQQQQQQQRNGDESGLQKLTFAELGTPSSGSGQTQAEAQRIEKLYDEMQRLDAEHLDKFKSQRERIQALLQDLKAKRDEALDREELAMVRACVERMDGLSAELVQLQSNISELEHRQHQQPQPAAAPRNEPHPFHRSAPLPTSSGRGPVPHARQEALQHRSFQGTPGDDRAADYQHYPFQVQQQQQQQQQQ